MRSLQRHHTRANDANREQTYHMFYLLMPSRSERDALIEHLRQAGILSVFHYVPLHNSPMGIKLGGSPGQCPVTEEVSSRLLRLPLFFDISEAELETVAGRIKSFELASKVSAPQWTGPELSGSDPESRRALS